MQCFSNKQYYEDMLRSLQEEPAQADAYNLPGAESGYLDSWDAADLFSALPSQYNKQKSHYELFINNPVMKEKIQDNNRATILFDNGYKMILLKENGRWKFFDILEYTE